MRNLFIILSLFFLAAKAPAHLNENHSLFEKANQSYSSADYAEAIALYETILVSGYESPGLYFNLGNSYFKLNNIPASILFYEKARKLDPTDENIKFNLELANSRIIDKMEPLPELFLKAWWRSARDLFSSDHWARFGIAGFILVLISFTFFIISRVIFIRKITFWSGITLALLMVVSFLFSFSSYREYSSQTSAIIFTPTVTVKSSPNQSSVDLFVIHEGTKVFITDQLEGWSEVKLANGNVGWIKTDNFRHI